MLRPQHIEEDIKSMTKNMIGYGKGLQNELKMLARQCPQEDVDRYVVIYKEFRDEFNPYKTSNTNNSILLHTQSILPIDCTVDTSEFTYPVACGHKHVDNMVHEKTYIETLNVISSPTNNIKFYSKLHEKFINIVMYNGGIMMDQPGKRDYYNHAGGNSDYGAKFGWSCNFKDIYYKLPSCHDCEDKLSIGIVDRCNNCYNWNFMNTEYSNECILNNGGIVKHSFKLTMKI